ncbi:DUF116 domain-containing protein [Desulfoplanes formicivorans]|uniref:DUF116 domain-containing protein n=1 Tax=Desulfoplanes formicivorans TaxID=1592317 RepID=A0A194AEC7_9BACT|nr:DUF116 domain-containing protein [Desulfoplanes formicivorans]GAU08437.1 hypothetical protein DPF_1146 [Desulfoplanes formicivorans]
MSKKDQNLLALEDAIESTYVARKRLFIGLITGTSVLICLILVFLWLIPTVGLGSIHPVVPWIFGSVILMAILLVAWSSLALVLNILLGRKVFLSRKMRGLTIKLFLPLMTMLGRFLNIPKAKIRASFIKVNNELVLGENKQYLSRDMLMLMPHCLQNSRCKIRLTYDINNCKRCGKCPIAGLLNLSDTYGVTLAIATGGTIARRIVVQNKPKFIIAVACERDLASGIQDVYPLPCFGVLNQRPYGPCLDTQVPLEHVEWAIKRFLKKDANRERNVHPTPGTGSDKEQA